MDPGSEMLILKGRIATQQVESCTYDGSSRQYAVSFTNGKIYRYAESNVRLLRSPRLLVPSEYRIVHRGMTLYDVAAISVFRDGKREYYHLTFANGRSADYYGEELTVEKSCANNAKVKDLLAYCREMADFSELRGDDGSTLLSKQYEKLDFLSEESALAAYADPEAFPSGYSGQEAAPIFPFGCNASQYKAVKAALENKISVIEGPPGTGKTQTILNIIANLLISGKTVQVVSNNNAATMNVYEKLASEKYNMGFLVAALGNADNKTQFIENQKAAYPDLTPWDHPIDPTLTRRQIVHCSRQLQEVYGKQEQLARAIADMQSLEAEERHFRQYLSENGAGTQPQSIRRLSSAVLMELWNDCQLLADEEKTFTFWFKLKCLFRYGIWDGSFFKQGEAAVLRTLQSLFYTLRREELKREIARLEQELLADNAEGLTQQLSELSLRFLQMTLFEKYGQRGVRKRFTAEDLRRKSPEVLDEYPIVLSTCFSARSTLGKDAMFDYVIMDEASQVDVVTGALALSCARNAVIVGDSKQLPNVITEPQRVRARAIFGCFSLPNAYDHAGHSFLASVCEAIPDLPRTLLREHYRCHPKIIRFCSEKFYGGELLIMSRDAGEPDVLTLMRTTAGNHERDHMNLRQIEVVRDELLPTLPHAHGDIGIIAPYNHQVNEMRRIIGMPDLDIATVHRFQGREKDVIILTTVDDHATDFSDDPFLLNVAVSRAKKQLCLVVSGNEQPSDSNIADLIDYMEYHNCSARESRIYSVFDLLYSQYTQSRLAYLKKHKRVSQYDSENLLCALIEDIMAEEHINDLGFICHQPLSLLLRDTTLLSDEERRYALQGGTHLDILIYSKISKKPLLAIEVDGYAYHKKGTRQAERDGMKDHILSLYSLPLLRFSTNGSREKERLTKALRELRSGSGKHL